MPSQPPASPPAKPLAASGGKGEINRLSTDHDLVQALVEAKTITPAEAKDHRFKNVLWKYLGSKEAEKGLDVQAIPASAGDRFLLCSDGLTGVVPDADLLAFIRANPDVQPCADGLAKLALDSGSRDNVSCIVAAINADGTLATGSCSLLGNYRENNEDTIAVVRFGGWTVCLVADGIGGQAAGEIASKKAVEVISRELRRNLDASAKDDAIRAAIRAAILKANEEIMSMASLDKDMKNMGTTIVLAVWRTGGKAMFTANVGDSRCYHIR